MDKKTYKKLNEPVEEELSKPIKEEHIIKYEEDGKTFKGYNAQVAINRLNDLYGIHGWSVRHYPHTLELVRGAWAVSMNVGIVIGKYEKIGSGGAYAKNIANAMKGARTSAFKNACRYLGIGKELYEENYGDEDIILVEEEDPANVTIPKELELLEQKIKEAKTIEQLKTLEDKVKAVEEKSVQKIIYTLYNKRKLELLT
jgi:hypothetical protein